MSRLPALPAMVLVLLTIGAGWACRREGEAVPAEVSELMAALGPRRVVEPRLTGTSFYAPCREIEPASGSIIKSLCSAPPPRGSAAFSALVRAGRRLHEQARVTPANLQARGLERLLWPGTEGAIPKAVELLRRAEASSPGNARIASDLAAALYVQSQESGEPRHLVAALAAAEKAVSADPDLPQALFNHALILERLSLLSTAAAAWERYRRVDPTSPWAEEALSRLARLRKPATPALWRQGLPALHEAVRRGDEEAVAALVAVSPQAAREHASKEALGSWGDLFLAGHHAQAEKELRLAAALGRSLTRLHGDRTVAEAVARIDEATGRREILEILAHGHRAYGIGSNAFARLEVEAADAPLRLASDTLGSAGSPVGDWAQVEIAGIAFYETRFEEAADGFSAILRSIDPVRYPALAGRAGWGLGLTRLRQGDFSAALVHYHKSADHFAKAREVENLGAVLELLAEVHRTIGNVDQAWRYRHQAIGLLSSHPSSIRLHNALWQAGDAALQEFDPRVALRFQNEDVRVAEASASPRLLAEALLWRSKIEVALGDFDRALADLRRADEALADIPAGAVRDKLRADTAFARAEAERQVDPLRALPLFDETIRYYRRHGLVLDLASAYLSRARAALSAGKDAIAEADFDAAIDLFERQRSEMQEDRLRTSYSETVQGLFDDRILFEIRRARPARAFELSERARLVPLGSAGGSEVSARLTQSPIGLRLENLPAGTTFIEYAWIGDHLLRWTVRRGEIVFEPREVDRRELTARIERFVRAIAAGQERRFGEAAKELYEDLIPVSARSLPEAERLWFVPDKKLNQVPFAALINPRTGKYLVEEHGTVALTLSVSSYLDAPERSQPSPSRWKALLVANPAFDPNLFPTLENLPEADGEIEELRQLYPDARVLAGPRATKAAFLASLDSQEILQYSGHAIDEPEHPAFARFVLAASGEDSGMLFAHEIDKLKFARLRLVILSACRTLSVQDLRVGGVSGLSRPFLDAGAQAVLGTLWDVTDSTARRFLPELHRHFLSSKDPAVALRDTQITLIRSTDPILRSPRTWAAYQLVGAIPPHQNGRENPGPRAVQAYARADE